MFKIDCAVQKYAWGKPGNQSSVFDLKKSSDQKFNGDINENYAELWMGTHPGGPSMLTAENNDDNQMMPLKEYLSKHPEYLGSVLNANDKNTGDLPFMFKVLSINTALSIQAHPDRTLAAKLHKEFPEIYKDDNHKPEMAVALTNFDGMCGFRPIEEMLEHFQQYPELVNMIEDKNAILALRNASTVEEKKQALKIVFGKFLNASEDMATVQIKTLIARLIEEEQQKEGECNELNQVIIRLSQQYPNDRGCMCPLLLNYVKLNAGESFFMKASEPHAYLSGDILECMACSDNVVRAGLTPKFIDKKTLYDMLTYDYGKPNLVKPTVYSNEFVELNSNCQNGNDVHVRKTYTPPIDEFEITVLDLPQEIVKEYTFEKHDSPTFVLVCEGEGNASFHQENDMMSDDYQDSNTFSLRKGEVYFLAANTSMKINNSSTMKIALAHSNMSIPTGLIGA